MPCKCNDKTVTLRCTNCGRLISISHGPDQDPLVVAQEKGLTCKRCHETNFEVFRNL